MWYQGKPQPMSRLISIAALVMIMTGVLAISGVEIAPAESCFRAARSEDGAYTTSSCTVGGPPYAWVWAGNTFNWTKTNLGLGPGNEVYCVKVQAGLPSWFTDSVCSIENHATGGYSLVFAEAGWIWGINPVKGRGKGTTTFQTTAGNIKCGEVTISAEPKAIEVKAQVMTVSYGKCTAFGQAATISAAEYEFVADGPLSVVNKNVVITVSGAKCTV